MKRAIKTLASTAASLLLVLAHAAPAFAGELKGVSFGEEEVEVIEIKSSEPVSSKYVVSGGGQKAAVCCDAPPKQKHKKPPQKAPPKAIQPAPIVKYVQAPALPQAASGGEKNIVTIDQRRILINREDSSDLRRRLREAESRASAAEAKAAAAEARAARMRETAKDYYHKYKRSESKASESPKATPATSCGKCGSCGDACGDPCCDKNGLFLGLAAGMYGEPRQEIIDDCIETTGHEYKPYFGARIMGVFGDGRAAVGAQLNTNRSGQIDVGFKVN